MPKHRHNREGDKRHPGQAASQERKRLRKMANQENRPRLFMEHPYLGEKSKPRYRVDEQGHIIYTKDSWRR